MDKILIVDFGSQYSMLIARKVRELGVYSEMIGHKSDIEVFKDENVKGIILSGGPESVGEHESPTISKEIFELGKPVLAICYGMQLTQHLFGGVVSSGGSREYGKTEIEITQDEIFANIPQKNIVWMSHSDSVTTIAKDFIQIAKTDSCMAALRHKDLPIFNFQFHPEVNNSEYGKTMLDNFINICNAKREWKLDDYIETSIAEIKKQVGNKKVILGLSGGVDSSVTAMLVHKAIGDNLTCVFVDTGLLRFNEGEKVMDLYREQFHMNIVHLNESDRFLDALKGVKDPEEKRKIIGKLFVEVFNDEKAKHTDADFLAQGTIYPDVIESSTDGVSKTIKSHHNVGGLPEDMKFELVEPLRYLFKDEVREIGVKLGIPHNMIYRHPFPGPGLGIRVIEEVTREKVEILQKADDIFITELYNYDLYDKTSQAFVTLLPCKTVGVMGDNRTYEYVCAIRSVNTIDFMTATFSKLPYEFLEDVSTKIINNVQGINRVVYDITNKAPGTVEWE